MASLVYNKFKTKLFKSDMDFDEGTDDIRAALLMTNTTADTEDDTEFLTGGTGFTTLDEFDGSGYTRITFASQSVNEDLTNNRVEFDAEDWSAGALGVGARDIQGALIFKWVTADTDSIPICWVEFTSPQPGGVTLTVQWNAEGILRGT